MAAASKEQAAAAMIQLATQKGQLMTQIANMQKQLTAIAEQQNVKAAEYLAASGGGDESFVYAGYIVVVKSGNVTVTAPQPTIISIATK